MKTSKKLLLIIISFIIGIAIMVGISFGQFERWADTTLRIGVIMLYAIDMAIIIYGFKDE
jgi:hypothetical protein